MSERRTVVTTYHRGKVYRGRAGCWHAYFKGEPGTWEAGQDPAEAIGKLRESTKYDGPVDEERHEECADCEGAALFAGLGRRS